MTKGAVAAVTVILVTGLVIGAGRLLLPACGLSSGVDGWLSYCPPPSGAAHSATLPDLAAERAVIENRIARLEDQLALLRCDAVPNAPVPVPASDEAIDEERWDAQDLDLLEGCWELDSDYQVITPGSGEITNFDAWEICFAPGAEGAGQQIMRSSEGAVCEGTVTSAFNDDGRLVITEPDDLPCSNGVRIYRRVATCSYLSGSLLDCVSTQPEVNSRGTFKMRPRN